MIRASGILLLVIFCYISGFSQDSTKGSDRQELDSGSVQEYNQLSKEFLGREPRKALDYSNKALEAAKRLNYKPGMAEALANLGQFYLDRGETNTALEYFTSYRKISIELQDSARLADAYCLIGMVHRQQQMYNTALKFYHDALTIARQHNYTRLLAKCYNQLGGLYYFKGEYKKANEFFSQSLQHISPEENRAEYAAAINNMGVVFKADKQYRKALIHLKEALSIMEELRNVRDLSVVLMNIGEIYQVYNDYDLAEIYYSKALEAAIQVNAVGRIVESYEYMAGLHAEKENYKRAYKYKSLYAAYKDTLAQNEQRDRLQEISKKLEVERQEKAFSQLVKDKEIELLNKENKISKLELLRKNNLFYLSAIISVLLTLLVLVFYNGNKLKKKQNEQLEEQHKRTYIHNRQLQEMNTKLSRSEQELKNLNDTKDKFFSIISHDLRGPLYTLAGFIQIMRKDVSAFSADELNRFSVQMERALQGVTALLDNLFQWATTQAGLIEFAPTQLKLHQVVEENTKLLQATADLKEISLQNEVAADFKITADLQMMRLALRNLIANAIKFTEKGGWVKINAGLAQEEVCISVQDNGIGMLEEDLQKLFQTKARYTQRGTENEKGSGLGLLLCKEFIELHKGRIEVKSKSGAGTTFTIWLPLAS
jgi:two-component system sensor histidine kinase/response regulator